MKITYLKSVIPALLFLPLMTSCNNNSGDSLYDDWENVLDNHGGMPYEFDKDGHCFGVTSIGKENMEKTLVGYGWKCYDTWEINADGTRQKQSYWKDRIGGSPTQYYFNADGTAREYFNSDAYPDGRLYRETQWKWIEDDSHGRDDNKRIVFGNYADDYLQITGWSKYAFCAIQYLGVRSDGYKVYGVSLYQRMTDKELDGYNKTYRNMKDVINP